MLDLPFILANSGDVNWATLIPIVLILLFWAIGAMRSAAKKAGGGPTQSGPRPVLPVPPPLPRAFGVPPYPLLPPAPPPLPPAVSRRNRQKRAAAAPPPLPARPMVQAPLAVGPEFPAARTGRAGGQTEKSSLGAAVGGNDIKARLTPEALRSAMVWIEIFDRLREGGNAD